MNRTMPLPLVPRERGRSVIDAELPPMSREEHERILELVGGDLGVSPETDLNKCKECEARPSGP